MNKVLASYLNWYNANKILPDESGWYLVAYKSYDSVSFSYVSYSKVHKKFNAFDNLDTAKNGYDVLWWSDMKDITQHMEELL